MTEYQPEPAPAPETRIRFGPRPHQVVVPEVASDMLTRLCERNRKVFGDLLQLAMLGDSDSPNGHRQ